MRYHDVNSVLELYGRWVVSSGVLDRVQKELGIPSRRGIYSLVVVLWLMIWQRLQPRGTMSHAVRQLVQGAGRSLLSPCKRVREGRISTGREAIARASKRCPNWYHSL